MARVLVIDDEETIRKLLSTSLQRAGHEVVAVEDGFRALDVVPVFHPNLIVSDIKMPRMDGFQFWKELKKKVEKPVPIIYITGHGDKAAAIEALHEGAFAYLEKPFDIDDLLHSVASAEKKEALERENIELALQLSKANEQLKHKLEAKTELIRRIQKSEITETLGLEALGVSSAMKPIKDALARLSNHSLGADMSVLISGASGSGKEVVARIIHDMSPRAQGPWVAVNCGAFPENLIESELFGHEKGAFTGATARRLGVFEMADGGTLFLDEVGELPLSMQAKLLRVLQERTFRRVGGTEEVKINTRIVSATNRNLQEAVKAQTFREDLLYRLNELPISLPPLSERKEDLPSLVSVLLKRFVANTENAPKGFSSGALSVLHAHSWPGNIRELRSVVQRAALITPANQEISTHAVKEALGVSEKAEVIPLTIAPMVKSAPSTTTAVPYHSWKKEFMRTMERDYLVEQLRNFEGNVSALARAMKVSRPNLCRLLKKHDLLANEFRKAA